MSRPWTAEELSEIRGILRDALDCCEIPPRGAWPKDAKFNVRISLHFELCAPISTVEISGVLSDLPPPSSGHIRWSPNWRERFDAEGSSALPVCVMLRSWHRDSQGPLTATFAASGGRGAPIAEWDVEGLSLDEMAERALLLMRNFAFGSGAIFYGKG